MKLLLALLALLTLTGCTAILAVDPLDTGTMSSILGGVGKATEAAASFLPAPWGTILATGGGLLTAAGGAKYVEKKAAQNVNTQRDLARVKRGEKVDA